MLDTLKGYGTEPQVYAIMQASSDLLATRKGATACTSAILECVTGAAIPLVMGLSNDEGLSVQDRLLFTLVLTGACVHLDDASHTDLGMHVAITPETVTEAFRVYQLLTGRDIKPFMPPSMVEFANRAARSIN
jgi:hypothetical protein